MSPEKRPTSHDVARLAGVSQTTVSLVFADLGSKRVSSITRERVREAARRLGYRPQTVARQLRVGRTGLVLFTVPDIRGPFFSRALAGAQEAAENTVSIVISSGWDRAKLADAAAGDQFDGLVLCSPTDRQVGDLPTRVPVLFLDAAPALAGTAENRAVLELDVAQGMRHAVEHLITLGHRSIGHLRYQRTSYTYRARRAAFRQATGGHHAVEHDIEPDGTLDAARRSARSFLADSSRPSAVVCDDDIAAAGVYHAAAELGLRIPDELSVVGFDNIDAAPLLAPALTTVDLNGELLGRQGIEVMAELLHGRPLTPPSPIEPSLVVRGSTRSV